jgi:site-specific DNA-methyltransferase (adenine-specific)
MRNSKASLYEDDTKTWGLIEGDALMLLARLPDACCDAIVTDPPYGIDFGGREWDGKDIRRVVSDGGAQVSAAEAFERWTRVWATEARRVLKPGGYMVAFGSPRMFHRLTRGAEDAGLEIRDVLLWLYGSGLPKSRRLPGGLGTNLKPAYEPILLARASFAGSVAGNLERYGTGALNIDAGRVGEAGYWPANLTLSHSPDCATAVCALDCPMTLIDRLDARPSRLFYSAKASRTEREAGCEQLPAQTVKLYNGHHHPPRVVTNSHPTVKPVALMQWLVRLVTPPGGLVLDPFTGSGSSGIAAVTEGRSFLGIEREAAYVDIACARLTHWAHQATRESP